MVDVCVLVLPAFQAGQAKIVADTVVAVGALDVASKDGGGGPESYKSFYVETIRSRTYTNTKRDLSLTRSKGHLYSRAGV